MPEDWRDQLPDDLASEATQAKEVEARRRALERAERLAVSELLVWARRSGRDVSRRERLVEHLVGLS